LLVELGLSVSGAILGIIGSSLIEAAIARLYVRPSFLGGFRFPVRQLWAYALPLFLFAFSVRVFSNLDLMLLKILGGTAAQAGIYGAAQNLATLPLLVVLPLNPLLLSALSRTRRERGERAGRDIIGNAMRGVIGLLPFVCVIVGAAREIVSFLFGSNFLPVAPLLSVLILGVLARSVVVVTTTMMTAAGKPAWTAALSVPLVPLAIAGHLWSIPRWGALGASFVTAVLSMLAALAGLLVVYRLWGLLPRVATVLRALVLCVPAYSMAAVWPTPGALLFVKLPAIGLLLLLGFLVLGEFSGSEIALARSLLSRRALSQEKPREA
jgi:O-antigen/teichoic acid export membrane protein